MNILLRNQLKFMSSHFEVTGVCSRDDKHFQEIHQREGVPVVDIEMTREISPVKDLRALTKMCRLFRSEKPAIVHSHTPKAGITAMIAAKISKVPIRLHTLGGMPLMETKGIRKWALHLSERLTYRCATCVFPNSRGLHKYVLDKKFIRANKLRVIGNGSTNGIDLEYFSRNRWSGNGEQERIEIRHAYGMNGHDTVFCFVGRLVRDKGIKELVSAFEKLETSLSENKESKNIRLLLVGPLISGKGELDCRTKEKIVENPSICHVGRHDDVRPFLLAADVFVFPSYREGFPNAVLQAGAMGLPSIVTDINGCNEIIVHNQNGLIVPPKDQVELMSAMRSLLEDEKLRLDLAANARPHIEKHFDQKYFWMELLKTYLSLLRDHAGHELSA